ncbi:hypothetical protein MKW92_033083 [Papaver armeniacum]|nr:hypothetical protein MKW92_033083 [Papaver armeniacum]
MGYHSRRESYAGTSSFCSTRSDFDQLLETVDLDWPFGKVEGVDKDDLRETAYEVFFTSCRSSPGFGGRNALSYYPSGHDNSNGDGGSFGGGGNGRNNNGSGLVATSRLKRTLGLKSVKRMSPRRTNSNPSSPRSPRSPNNGNNNNNHPTFSTLPVRFKRPMTSAEIMRQQMRVSEQGDNRLRKTLMRTLVGQMGRRAETIILPLELLRHLKASEFNNAHEYHLWQKRQLKILEAGLLHYPSIPLDRSNSIAMKLREIIDGCEMKPIDIGKNSETMPILCNCVVSLAWRSNNGSSSDVCHWADGSPFNIHLYLYLLYAIFDIKDETLVLDEVDELLELMKKTWSTLGISKIMHNICFTWVLFQQYVATSQTEQDLLGASIAMLSEVENDVKRANRDTMYIKTLTSVLGSIYAWAEKRLVDYHGSFQKGISGVMENLLSLALTASKILDDLNVVQERGDAIDEPDGKVDFFIRSSLRNVFSKMLESGANSLTNDEQEDDATEALLQLAKETEELAVKEKLTFSPTLKRWHPIPTGVASVTLHSCYGAVLRQYLSGVSTLSNEVIRVLERAGKLEKILVQMVVEDSVDCEDGGKAVVREMVPYEVDSIILNLLKTWIGERLEKLHEYLERAKETETWNPKSKTEPYTQSAVDIMRLAKEIANDFFEIPIGISEDIIQDLADGLEHHFQDYINFVASCGSKQSYIPSLPPLTRCNRDSRFLKLWRKASPCKMVPEDLHRGGITDGHHPRPSTSRGTQRLYIRLNTLHYLLSELHSLDKILSLSPRHQVPSHRSRAPNCRRNLSFSPSYFDHARSTIQTATQNVSEVAAYRLIFLDSNSVFYDSLYVGDVVNARVRPAVRILKQNLVLLSAMVTDKAQPLAIKEVMKATFEAYLMVLLAGGSSRIFTRSDHEMLEEDFESLKRVFCTCGEGVVAEDVVEREAETVEGVVGLMGQSTEQLVEDFSIVACETSGMGVVGAGQKLPMPPTSGRWNRADPNTILRVLCHRNDGIANRFLKTTFQLAKRC